MSVSEILQNIEKSIQNVQLGDEFSQKGTIIEIKDGVATVAGLEQVKFSELVEFENGTKGLVLDLVKDYVGVLILGEAG